MVALPPVPHGTAARSVRQPRRLAHPIVLDDGAIVPVPALRPITWTAHSLDPLCVCCLRAGGMSFAPPGTIDHRQSRPHREHDHLWPDPATTVSVRPRRCWVFVCQTCGDVSLASKAAHCLGRTRATVRRERLLLRLREDGRLSYSFAATADVKEAAAA